MSTTEPYVVASLIDALNQANDDLRTLSEAIREIESLAAMLTDVKIRDAAAAGIEFCCRRAATRGAMSGEQP